MPKTLTTVLLAFLAAFAAWLNPVFGDMPPIPKPLPDDTPSVAEPLPVDIATNHVTVVLDTSGSMSDRGKLSYAKQLVRTLNRRHVGTVSLVTFSDRATLVLSADQKLDDAALTDHLYAVSASGSSNLYDGLRVATQSSPAGSSVLVISDGVANVGQTTPAALEAMASELHRQHVRLYTVSLSEDAQSALAPLGRNATDGHRRVERPRDLVATVSDLPFMRDGGWQ